MNRFLKQCTDAVVHPNFSTCHPNNQPGVAGLKVTSFGVEYSPLFKQVLARSAIQLAFLDKLAQPLLVLGEIQSSAFFVP